MGNWNWNRSAYWHSLKLRVLNMVDVVLLVVLLDYWLSNNLLSWNLYSLHSCDILCLNRLHYLFKLDILIISSGDLYDNFFSLDDWLEYSLIIDFISRFYNEFFSIIFSYNRFLSDWIQVH